MYLRCSDRRLTSVIDSLYKIRPPDAVNKLMQEEAEDDTHSSEARKELEASVATLREELALER